MVMNTYLEGWHTDPFGLHEARWMSDGTPTKLVLDQGKESYDSIPYCEPIFAPEPFLASAGPQDSSDLNRSDAPIIPLDRAFRRAGFSILHNTHG